MEKKKIWIALLILGCIIITAFAEINTPKDIKELIANMQKQLEKNEDAYPALVNEVEQYTMNCSDSVTKAVLHSMLAELYARYYQNNWWKITERTPIIGYVPEEIEAWTGNIFTDTIQYHVAQSLANPVMLQQTPVSRFSAILTEGANSKSLRPTLFDFLSYRDIATLQRISNRNQNKKLIDQTITIYKQLIAFRKKADNPKALLLTELNYLNYIYTATEAQTEQTQYMNALDSLQQQYASNDFSVEIAIARYNLYNSYLYNQPNTDSIQYALCEQEIDRFPNYERIGILKNYLNQLITPTLSATSAKTIYPGKDLTLNITFKRIPELSVAIYRSTTTPENYFYNRYKNKDKDNEQGRGELLKQITYKLDASLPYASSDTSFSIRMELPGIYEYVISSGEIEQEVTNVFSVSRLFAASRNLQNDADVLVTDLISGKPVKDARVLFYTQKDFNAPLALAHTALTDKDGLALSGKDIRGYRVIHNEDSAMMISPIYIYPPQQYIQTDKVSLFTDRSIYRPGQTVFFKGIAFTSNTDQSQIITNKKYTVILRNANGEEVAKKELITDSFGSFNDKFTLPQNALDGIFSLNTDEGYVSFSVEEYKRPTFLIDFSPLTTDVVLGDEVFINGSARTFSGANLQGEAVRYRVVRYPQWYRGLNKMSSEQVAEGTTSVTNQGTFTISFRSEKGNDTDVFNTWNYEVTALITDSKGESEEANYSFLVGSQALVFTTDLSGKVNKDSTSTIISVSNINRQPLVIDGIFTLYQLKESKEYLNNNMAPEKSTNGKQVYKGNFKAQQPIDIRFMSKLESGAYQLCMEALDSQKRIVKDTVTFILYGSKDKKPPVLTSTWFLPVKTECLPGENAEIIFGTSMKKAFVLYEILKDGKTFDRKIVEMDNENKTFRIPYTENFGNNVDVSFTFVKDGTLYNEQVNIYKKQPDHSLTIHTKTFRDRLLPGQTETWSFQITNADSLPVSAEVMASMYDASLDAIIPHYWFFNPKRSVFPISYFFNNSQASGSLTNAAKGNMPFAIVPEYQFDQLNWQGLLTIQNRPAAYLQTKVAGARLIQESDKQVSSEEIEKLETAKRGDTNNIFAEKRKDDEESTVTLFSQQQPTTLRRNFNETAFFYPSLQTNKNGDIIIKFEVPQSNTTWKLMMLAYTKQLQYGQFAKEAVSQKKLMVLPNLPRFMRTGDEVSISTQVINLSNKEVSGRVRMELFDPATDQPIICLTKSDKSFTLAAGATTDVSWAVQVPKGTDLIGCRIIAETPENSDGEQQLIPVLPNELMVTESKPFAIDGAGEKTIETGWSALNSAARPFRMTLEYSNNPTWYAVQALPTITLPDNDNAISWFAAYYSNTLATYIAGSSPKIRNMIEQWEKQGGNSETLYSNLEKNQELKNILLQETPWVLEAKNETEQKQRLSLLFNSNYADSQRKLALDKLQTMQNTEGGWSWFPNMPASREITLYVLKGMAQLTQLGAVQYGETEKMMQINALRFLDKSIQKEYEALLKIKGIKPEIPTLSQLELLFVRSEYRDIPEDGSAREAIRYYTMQAEKYRNQQSLYGKALTAQLLYRNGNKGIAQSIIKSLRQLATISNEMGMYWANNKETMNFLISPVSVHCQLMNAFSEIQPEVKEITLMKLWLLKQKQTQNWKSVPATVNAIYAILENGTDWLSDNGSSSLTWGNQTYSTTSGELGTGYIQEVLTANEITPDKEKIVIRKTGNTPAWGAVYRQYFSKIENIIAQEGNLSVDKKLFVNVTNTNGVQLQPVTENTPLKVGDKVTVRLTLRTNQTMDYVQLKDLRAGCFEPTEQLSGMEYRNGLSFYRSPGDVSENFFFSHLPQGVYVIEYSVYVSRAGRYAGGISTIQCLYAPEFISHTEGYEINVKE